MQFSYVPMFGETEYDPSRQYSSVPIEEQLDALGRAVDAGKVWYLQVDAILIPFTFSVPIHTDGNWMLF